MESIKTYLQFKTFLRSNMTQVTTVILIMLKRINSVPVC